MSASILPKISAVSWFIWGFVHAFAGVMVIGGDATAAVQAIADAVSADTLAMSYPDAVGGIINQHGWNLLWFGVATAVGAIFIWRNSVTAIFITAMVGGLADLGYFIFLDLAGYVNFVPGTVMTIVSSLAIILSFVAYYQGRSATR